MRQLPVPLEPPPPSRDRGQNDSAACTRTQPPLGAMGSSRRDLLRALAGAGVLAAASPQGWAASALAQEAGYLTWAGYELRELQTHYRTKYGADPVVSTFLDSADGFERLRGGPLAT